MGSSSGIGSSVSRTNGGGVCRVKARCSQVAGSIATLTRQKGDTFPRLYTSETDRNPTKCGQIYLDRTL